MHSAPDRTVRTTHTSINAKTTTLMYQCHRVRRAYACACRRVRVCTCVHTCVSGEWHADSREEIVIIAMAASKQEIASSCLSWSASTLANSNRASGVRPNPRCGARCPPLTRADIGGQKNRPRAKFAVKRDGGTRAGGARGRSAGEQARPQSRGAVCRGRQGGAGGTRAARAATAPAATAPARARHRTWHA